MSKHDEIAEHWERILESEGLSPIVLFTEKGVVPFVEAAHVVWSGDDTKAFDPCGSLGMPFPSAIRPAPKNMSDGLNEAMIKAYHLADRKPQP